jgi:hypothetical protein
MNRRDLLQRIVLGSSCVTIPLFGQPPSVRVLFFGNSHTYTHDVPTLFAALCNSTSMFTAMVDAVVDGGVSLKKLASDYPKTKALVTGAADGKPWDVLVLQEQSGQSCLGGLDAGVLADSTRAAHELIDLYKAANPNLVVILYQTWARHPREWTEGKAVVDVMGANAATMHRRMRDTHKLLLASCQEHVKGSKVKVIVSPVGDFWAAATKAHPEIDFYNPNDNNHASLKGAWMAALTILGSVAGRDAIVRASWHEGLSTEIAESLRKLLLDRPEVFREAGR